MSTCRAEIEAALISHLAFPRPFNGMDASQEPIITLRGLPVSGVEHFFRKWFWDPDQSAWIANDPMELRRLLRMDKFSGTARRQMGPCRLYFVRASGSNRPAFRASAVL